MEIMQEFPLEGLHFYCETFDVTRPYPSSYPVDMYVQLFRLSIILVHVLMINVACTGTALNIVGMTGSHLHFSGKSKIADSVMQTF